MNQLTLSNLSLFETTKEQRQQFCANVIDVLSEGMADPLKIHLQVKCLEDIIKQITSNAAYKDFLLTEASKYGKTFEHHNLKNQDFFLEHLKKLKRLVNRRGKPLRICSRWWLTR